MSTACFIPVKTRSTRVPGKNLRKLSNKRLFEYIIDAAKKSRSFDQIYVDTDNDQVMDYAHSKGCLIINREPELAKDNANGNDLLNFWYSLYPDYSEYFQLFATSPLTRPETISECVEILKRNSKYDSVLTTHEKCGWYWFDKSPINYDPRILPRSQDANKVFSETTALYGIKNRALANLRSRIGLKPYFYFVDDIESIDIDSEFDFKLAEIMMNNKSPGVADV